MPASPSLPLLFYVGRPFIAPGSLPHSLPTPTRLSRRDERGDLQLGRRFGLDLSGRGKEQILRVDGPHSAPAEHYVNYKTVMIIGAGIGMTPCASILTAMLKYR